jgi:hypothetical protein
MLLDPIKVVLLGSAKSTRELIPVGDFAVWSLLQNNSWLSKADLWFELHNLDSVPIIQDIIKQQIDKGQPVLTQSGPGDIFPIDEIIECVGTRYFTSSFDFMCAYCLYHDEDIQPIDEIHVIGFNFQGKDEYARQIPGASYWIGRLEGAGIKVVLQESSAMRKSYKMYAYGDHSELALIQEKADSIKQEKARYQEKINATKAELAKGHAALDELNLHMRRIEGAEAIITDTRELLIRGGA